jgi:AcrR family transcriptional regulator
MARPSKTDDPRRSILRAAREMVLEGGHRKLSLRAVAARAGFAPPSLYEYFDGKDDLLSTLAGEVSGRLGDAMTRAAHKGRRPAVALVDLGLAYVSFARENREDFLLLFSGLESKRRGAGQPVPAGSPYQGVVDAVRRALAARGARPSQPTVEKLAYALWATVHGMAMLQATHLRGYAADFPAADRHGLKALVSGLGLDSSG